MNKYSYTAMDSKGTECVGTIEAANQAEGISKIRGMGLFPVRIIKLMPDGSIPPTVTKKTTIRIKKAASTKAAVPRASFRFPFSGVSTMELAGFARKVAVLMDSGLPLLRGLRILSQQESNGKLRKAIVGIGEAVESGSTFSEALAIYPKIFDKKFVNMAKAGEAGGVLEVTMSRLADYLEKEVAIKNGMSASILFSAVSAFAFSVIASLLGATLGLNPFVIGTVIIIALGTKVIMAYRNLSKNRDMSSFARVLGTLMNCGVPVLQALNITRDSCRRKSLREATQAVHDAVKEGDCMGAALTEKKAFPPMIVSMIDVGEETGALPEMLLKISDLFDKAIDTSIVRLNLFNSIVLSLSIAAVAAIALIK